MNIVVSLTTVPTRLHNAGEPTAKLALKNLLEQSYSPYEVHFNVPTHYKEEEVIIPSWLDDYQNKYNHLKVFRTPDYGAITKLLPTLERITDPETIIIVVDDDLYYMDGIIKEHINGRIKYPDCALGFAGMTALDGSCHFCTTLNKDTRVKLLEGYKTVSYKRSFFDNLEDLKTNFVDKTWNDDVSLSAYMGYKNIHKIVLSYSKDTDFSPRVESFPVIGHIPAERGGCSFFRHCEESQAKSEKNIQEFFRLGYLER